jgi:uncharacterized membrane protein (DUF373 family)
MKAVRKEDLPTQIVDRTQRPGIIPEHWKVMTFYERFEQIIAIILSFIISIVVIFTVLQLIIKTYALLFLANLNTINHQAFQVIFGMIMTILIAMEFKHSILTVLKRSNHIVQAKAVILLGLLAMTRKFIIVNLELTEPFKLIALAFCVLVLGCVYWLLNQQDKIT